MPGLAMTVSDKIVLVTCPYSAVIVTNGTVKLRQ